MCEKQNLKVHKQRRTKSRGSFGSTFRNQLTQQANQPNKKAQKRQRRQNEQD